MFVDKETKRLAETLAEKLQGMTGSEDLHPSQVQWLFDVSELLGQLS